MTIEQFVQGCSYYFTIVYNNYFSIGAFFAVVFLIVLAVFVEIDFNDDKTLYKFLGFTITVFLLWSILVPFFIGAVIRKVFIVFFSLFKRGK